ncbi:hypothetical protein QTN24_05580 [Cupriavidus sp. SZY C1]|uniref:hypothetical protein n=1 Tax=Cupriavidus sp. SZY C1 TaxID=3055037 RepID=UPI0028B7C5A9|nr:hypothetical protein [Cupriavidus sp. SZY C1]MDT6960959.1 hypothetical protein [Cupriavidus sp. SZY C1]
MLWIIVVNLAKGSKIEESVRGAGPGPVGGTAAAAKTPAKSRENRQPGGAEFWQQSLPRISLQVTD